MAISVVALAPAEAKDKVTALVSKAEKVSLDLKGVATSIDELKPMLAEAKPQAVLISSSFAEKAEAIKAGIHAVAPDMHVIAIPAGKTGQEAIDWLSAQFAK